MDARKTPEIERTRRIRRIAPVSVITWAVLASIAVGIYVFAFVILSSMTGRLANHGVSL
jgi:hypothetical protein